MLLEEGDTVLLNVNVPGDVSIDSGDVDGDGDIDVVEDTNMLLVLIT